MKPLYLFFILTPFLFAGCSKETSEEVEEGADAVIVESKEKFTETKDQVAEIAGKAKAQAVEAAEVVKVKAQEAAEAVSEDLKAVKDATTKKVGVIVEEASEGAQELKDKADVKLQGIFNKQEDAPTNID